MPQVNCEGFIEQMTDVLGEPDKIEDEFGYYSMQWRKETEKGMRVIEATYFGSGLVTCHWNYFDISIEKVLKMAEQYEKEKLEI